MLTKTSYTVPIDLLSTAVEHLPNDDFRSTINQPTGNFFYDPWEIKPEYKGTVWELLYSSLPFATGEARIINLAPATCYQSHADIDDRYHLNLVGENCYLIDFDSGQLHQLTTDGIWYTMDAGKLHSAANFGRLRRTQLVVRKLLTTNLLKVPVKVKLTSSGLSKDDTRFMFDQTVSGWLNRANKQGLISNFEFNHGEVLFEIEQDSICKLKSILIKEFNLEII
jgi:hypothetical protein